MCDKIPCGFLIIWILTFICFFFSSTLNLILSQDLKEEEDILISPTNYDRNINKQFLTGINFGTNLKQSSGYGETGKIKTICKHGMCNLNNQKNILNQNCSDACTYFQPTCYDNGIECKSIICYDFEKLPVKIQSCHEYNRINIWKGLEVELNYENYTFHMLHDTVKYGGKCREGLKQCGYLNKANDLFCVDSSVECPINKIVVQESEIAPNDFEYKKVKFGDKYLFYTNGNITGYLYKGLLADSDVNHYYSNYQNVIDTDTLYNFVQNNPFTYEGQYGKPTKTQFIDRGTAKLHLGEDKDMLALTEIEIAQEFYNKIIQSYPENTIKEMNSNLKSGIGLLKILGIIMMVIYLFIGIILINGYTSKCQCGYSCKCRCEFFKNMHPMKNVIVFCIAFSPAILSTIISFFIVLVKKTYYNSYSNNSYIEDLYYCPPQRPCIFPDNKTNIDGMFICVLVQIILFAVSPLITFLVYRCPSKEVEPIPSIEIDMVNMGKNRTEEITVDGGSYNNPTSYGASQPNPDFALYNPGYNPGYNQGNNIGNNPGYNPGYNPGNGQ